MLSSVNNFFCRSNFVNDYFNWCCSCNPSLVITVIRICMDWRFCWWCVLWVCIDGLVCWWCLLCVCIDRLAVCKCVCIDVQFCWWCVPRVCIDAVLLVVYTLTSIELLTALLLICMCTCLCLEYWCCNSLVYWMTSPPPTLRPIPACPCSTSPPPTPTCSCSTATPALFHRPTSGQTSFVDFCQSRSIYKESYCSSSKWQRFAV